MLVQQVEKLLELILQLSGIIGRGPLWAGDCSGCFGGGGRSGAGSRGGAARSGWWLRLGASLETGLQVVVVAGCGLHIVPFCLLCALLVVQIDEAVTFLQQLSRFGGVA